jgi:hypothetical protein
MNELGEVVDTQPRSRVFGVEQGSNQAQQCHSADRGGQALGQPGLGATTQCKRDRAQHPLQRRGAPAFRGNMAAGFSAPTVFSSSGRLAPSTNLVEHPATPFSRTGTFKRLTICGNVPVTSRPEDASSTRNLQHFNYPRRRGDGISRLPSRKKPSVNVWAQEI